MRTVARHGYREQCANVGRLLSQVKFTVDLENQLIAANANDHLALDVAAKKLLHDNVPLVRGWLEGVKTREGGDAWAAASALITAP